MSETASQQTAVGKVTDVRFEHVRQAMGIGDEHTGWTGLSV